ncbi:MAG: hypothetical protein LCI02_04890 [Proteobacteria bacterium]|nr:hypothetical protein [Pseudomonadota bacterium]
MGLFQNPPAAVPPAVRLRQAPEGPEKYCPRCDDWWPADGEFFWRRRNELFFCCKACYHDMDRSRPGRYRTSPPPAALPVSWPPATSTPND